MDDGPPAPGLDPRVAYCVTVHACALAALDQLSDCASNTSGPPIAMQQCIAAAGADCASARACLYDASHPSLCAFGAAPACMGDVALACDPMTTITAATDCTLVGEQCVVGTTTALCAHGTCDDPPERSYCAGAIAARCVKPFLVGDDCASEGASCTPAVSDGGLAHCTGAGAACIASSCADRHTLARCLDGHRALAACPDGTSCFASSSVLSEPACLVAGACDPTTYFDSCASDGTIGFCRSGVIANVDCRALGFAGCVGSPASGCVTALVDAGPGPGRLTDAPLP